MAYWAYSGIPKYEKYMDYLINRLVLGYFLELLEIALTHLERNWPGAAAFQRSVLTPWPGFVSWPVEPACGHVTATAARKPGIKLLPKIL